MLFESGVKNQNFNILKMTLQDIHVTKNSKAEKATASLNEVDCLKTKAKYSTNLSTFLHLPSRSQHIQHILCITDRVTSMQHHDSCQIEQRRCQDVSCIQDFDVKIDSLLCDLIKIITGVSLSMYSSVSISSDINERKHTNQSRIQNV